jgi:hypothetical protein
LWFISCTYLLRGDKMEKAVSKKPFKIIWAVDPSAKIELKNVAIAMKTISALARKRQATVEPVYLLSTSLASTPTQTVGDTMAIDRATFADQFNALV